MLPVEQMMKLHEFRPDINTWIIDQTAKEAEDRRFRQNLLDKRTFVERIFGQIFGFFIGIAGVIGGSVTAYAGQPVAGGTIATVSIGTLAVAFLIRRRG